MLTQRIEQTKKIGRWRRLDFNVIRTHRMCELQLSRVQGLAAEVANGFDESVTGCRRDRHSTAIYPITHERMPFVREVNADLMRSSGFELDTYIGVCCQTIQHPVMGDGRFALVLHAHAQTIDRMTPYRRVDGSATGQYAVTDRQIFSGNLACGKHTGKGRVCLQGLGGNQQAGRFFIQPVDDSCPRQLASRELKLARMVLQPAR